MKICRDCGSDMEDGDEYYLQDYRCCGDTLWRQCMLCMEAESRRWTRLWDRLDRERKEAIRCGPV